MKIAKFEKFKWASVFPLVFVMTKLGEKFILVKVKILIGGKGFENFDFPIVGSKIQIVVDPSVTY